MTTVGTEATRSRASEVLLALESLGFLSILALWVPVYHRLLRGSGGDRPGAGIAGKVLAASLLVQVCYWVRWRLHETGWRPRSDALRHAFLFLSRLAFVYLGSSFSVLVVRLEDTRFSTFGLGVAAIALFSVFCYGLELERMGRSAAGSTATD